MSTFSVDGLISGLSTSDIIAKLGQVDRAPILRLKSRQSAASGRLSSWQTLNTKLLALKDKAKTLDQSATFTAAKAAVTDSTVLAASASPGASVGSYSVTVDNLAAAHQIVSANATSDKDALTYGTGTLTITVNGTAKNVTITSTNNSLTGIAKAINDAKAGVTASVIQDAAGYKLMVGSNSTGASYAITWTNSLSGGTTTLGSMNTLQAAQDAQIKLGTGGSALTITRSSNIITDVIPGVSLALGKASASAVTVTVSRDTDSMKNAVNAFVSAYNDLVGYITDQTNYDADKKIAGPLLGDGTVRRIQRMLPDIVTTATLSSGTVRNLAQMGVSLGADGKLTVDSTKLNTAVTEYLSDVQSLMATTGSATDPDIAFVSAGPKAVVPTTAYAVSISQAATKGSWTASTRTLGMTDPGVAAAAVTVGTETLTFSGALFPSPKSIDFSLGTTPQQMADAINADANLNGKVYAQVDGTGHLEIYGKQFGQDFTVTSSGVGTGSGYSVAGTNSSQTSSGIPAQVTGTTAVGETLTVDGSTTVTIASGKTLAQAASDFNAAMVTAGKALRATVSGLALVFERNVYGSGSNTLASNSASAGALGVGTTTQTIQGQDVDGTINGEAATGSGQFLTGDIGNATTEGLVIQVGLSAADLASQGSSQGTVTFRRGAGARLAVEIGALLEEDTGAVPAAIEQIEDTIKLYDKQIAAWEQRAEQRRAAYVRMFTNLERSLGTLRTQSSWLTQQISGFNQGRNR